ncbi:hypothetical protein H2203_006537 [Taxawa tesnikishii (nom. ined.)]|nr:hypothetical protein H2203_006537 [Dothideales sp. JES 119]
MVIAAHQRSQNAGVGFFDLPRELRDSVYELYLEGFLGDINKRLRKEIAIDENEPTIFAASRQLKAEFSPLFYSRVALRINISAGHPYRNKAHKERLERIGNDRIRTVPSITFYVDIDRVVTLRLNPQLRLHRIEHLNLWSAAWLDDRLWEVHERLRLPFTASVENLVRMQKSDDPEENTQFLRTMVEAIINGILNGGSSLGLAIEKISQLLEFVEYAFVPPW